MQYHEFTNPTPSYTSLDRFIIRRAILEALRAELPRIRGSVLDVGCGEQPYREILLSPPSGATIYIGLDIQSDLYGRSDVFWDGQVMPIAADSIDCAIATEVLEHVPSPERFLAETERVLKPSGLFFFTVPFLWPLHTVPFDEYRYTPFALERFLRDAGFTRTRLKALGGWDASLAQMIGLWVRRRPMSTRNRSVLSRLSSPIVQLLARRDSLPETFGEGTMITGVSGTAIKAPRLP